MPTPERREGPGRQLLRPAQEPGNFDNIILAGGLRPDNVTKPSGGTGQRGWMFRGLSIPTGGTASNKQVYAGGKEQQDVLNREIGNGG